MPSRFKHLVISALVLFVVAGFTLLAHPMTLKGTVAAVETKRIQVKTGGEKKGASPEWALIDAKTKILRNKTVVTLEQAGIKIGERVVVNADHRADGTMKALEIRLAAREAGSAVSLCDAF